MEKWNGLGGKKLVGAVLGLAGGVFVAQAGEYALGVSAGTSRAWESDAIGYNGKMQGNPWYTDPFDNTNLIQVLSRSKVGSFRYPGGTLANYFDWVNGKDNRKSVGHYLTSNLKLAYDEIGFTPTFTINMLTGTLQEALDGLQAAKNQGLPITHVEMGNEFYLSDADYENKWSSGTEYGQDCQAWITSIKNQFPGVRCAVVATMKTGTRTTTWSDEVFAACSNYDAVVVHWYQQSALEPAVVDGNGTPSEQDTQWAAFTAADGPEIMLAQPNGGWQGLKAGNDLPAGVDIWVTEFNLKDSNGAVRQTWANGLFNANQIHAFLEDGRVSRIHLHNWLSSRKQAIFGEADELDHVLTSHGQGSLATTPYEFGAAGQVVRMFAETMTGATSIAPLGFESSPQVSPAGYRSYDAVYGWRFVEGGTNRAILVNTSGTNYFIQTSGIAPSDSHVRQLSGDPHTYVTGENETLSRVTSDGTPTVLRLPAYSITTLGAEADAAPSGGSPHAPAFSASSIAKPSTTAYDYYSQSLTGDASDADGDNLVFRKVSGPAWAVVWSDGTLAGRPGNSDAGTNQIVVEVMDEGGLADQATMNVTVNSGTAPSPPPIPPSAYIVAEDSFVYSGSQADTVQTLDAALDIRSTASANYSRVPYLKFNIDELSGTVSNATLKIYSNDLDQSAIIYGTASGWSESTITWNNRPAFGSAIGTNTFSCGWNEIDITDLISSTGTYCFAVDEQGNATRYTLSSRRGSNPAYIEIVFVSEANEAPVFSNDPFNGSDATVDEAYTGTVNGSATDANAGDTLGYSKLSGPAWLGIASDGTLSGTPTSGNAGTNAFGVLVSDGNGGSDTATLNIAVNAATVWSELLNDDFESGWGGWVGGGVDAFLSGNNAIGSQCVDLEGNTGDAASIWLVDSLNLAGYEELKVAFSYYAVGIDNANEDLWLRFSDDAGATWSTVKAFVLDADFANNAREYPEILINRSNRTFGAACRLRLECNASGGGDDFFIDNIVVSGRSSPASAYDRWVSGNALVGDDAAMGADPDGDGVGNLGEYAMGGNPANAADVGHVPEFQPLEAGGTNYFEYVYAKRNDAAVRGLGYLLQLSTNLVSGVWTNGNVEVLGTGVLDAEFDSVTNRVPAAGNRKFIRLRIEY